MRVVAAAALAVAAAGSATEGWAAAATAEAVTAVEAAVEVVAAAEARVEAVMAAEVRVEEDEVVGGLAVVVRAVEALVAEAWAVVCLEGRAPR